MTSCRDRIAEELVVRLRTNAGWTVERGERAGVGNVPVLAVVYQIGENKRVASTEHYACTLRLGVLLRSGVERASPTLDGGNAQRYMDRLLTLAEKAVHASTWPDEVIVSLEGHEVAPPGEANQIEALLTITFEYRHEFADPEAFL